MEAAGGAVLIAAAVVALLWANSPFSGAYGAMCMPSFGSLARCRSRRMCSAGSTTPSWRSSFFVVGLEIKRELVTGELRDRRAAALPAVAAVGGVALPALIFLALVGGGPESRGWGIPIATDITFRGRGARSARRPDSRWRQAHAAVDRDRRSHPRQWRHRGCVHRRRLARLAGCLTWEPLALSSCCVGSASRRSGRASW